MRTWAVCVCRKGKLNHAPAVYALLHTICCTHLDVKNTEMATQSWPGFLSRKRASVHTAFDAIYPSASAADAVGGRTWVTCWFTALGVNAGNARRELGNVRLLETGACGCNRPTSASQWSKSVATAARLTFLTTLVDAATFERHVGALRMKMSLERSQTTSLSPVIH